MHAFLFRVSNSNMNPHFQRHTGPAERDRDCCSVSSYHIFETCRPDATWHTVLNGTAELKGVFLSFFFLFFYFHFQKDKNGHIQCFLLQKCGFLWISAQNWAWRTNKIDCYTSLHWPDWEVVSSTFLCLNSLITFFHKFLRVKII